MGNAILIKIKKGNNQAITKNDLITFKRKNGNIPKHSSIIFHTEWQDFLNRDFYFIDNPDLSQSATNYLVSKEVNLVGIDSPSIDLGKEKTFSVHKILAKNNILIVENLLNLNKIRSKYFDFIILSLKLKDVIGFPVRVLAIQRTK